MRTLITETRFAARAILRRPGISAVIVLILAVGVGANMSMFSGFDAWVVRPLPFEDPERLVTLHESQPELGRNRGGVAPATLQDWRQQQPVFTEVEAFARRDFNLNDDERPESVYGAAVSAGLFPLLGLDPTLGRGFAEEEDLPDGARVALISHGLWQSRFEADESILGDSLRIDGRVHEIVGVMPPGFAFPEWAEVWTPLALDPADQDREHRWITPVARLAPQVSLEDARSAMTNIASRLEALHPETNSGWGAHVRSLRDYFVPPVIETALWACVALAIFVMLVICANVANLLLAQATARQREAAVRAAIGAHRLQLARQPMIEVLLLALAASGAGWVLGQLLTRWAISWVPVDPPYLFEFRSDLRVIVFTLAVALSAGLLCGLAPALRSARVDLFSVLRSGRGDARSGRTASRLRSALVIAEFAVTVLLVIGAVLVAKSFYRQQQVDPGYRCDQVFTLRLNLRGETYSEPTRREEFLADLRSGIQRLDSVQVVGAANHLPLARTGYSRKRVEVEGQPVLPGQAPETTLCAITPGYLETLEIPVVEGRGIGNAEFETGAPVAIVSRSLARQLWPDSAAILQRLRLVDGEGEWLDVIGVIEDVDPGQTMIDYGSRPGSQLYIPYRRWLSSGLSLAVRSAAAKDVLAPALRRAVQDLDPSVAMSEVLTMAETIDEARWTSRYFSQLFMLYACCALIIAALGAYGVLADLVAGRRREIGIRLAVGARPGQLVGEVLRHGLTLGGVGVALGVLGALAVTHMVSSMLLGVSPRDPAVFVGVVVLMAVVACAAAFLPARRAARVDPMQVLRFE